MNKKEYIYFKKKKNHHLIKTIISIMLIASSVAVGIVLGFYFK